MNANRMTQGNISRTLVHNAYGKRINPIAMGTIDGNLRPARSTRVAGGTDRTIRARVPVRRTTYGERND